MADFCKQCAQEMWPPGHRFSEGDFEGLTTPEDTAAGMAALVLCEGCGPIQVDVEGACVSSDCLKGHGRRVGEP